MDLAVHFLLIALQIQLAAFQLWKLGQADVPEDPIPGLTDLVLFFYQLPDRLARIVKSVNTLRQVVLVLLFFLLRA